MTNKNSTLEKSNGTATFHPSTILKVEETTEGLHIRPSADRRATRRLAASLDAEEVQIRARQATDRMPVAIKSGFWRSALLELRPYSDHKTRFEGR